MPLVLGVTGSIATGKSHLCQYLAQKYGAVHGDADKLVPFQQAESFLAAAKKLGLPAKLVVKKGAGHGWADWRVDLETCAQWFDEHLRGLTPEQASP